ncbi:AbrB/MazE/SpoVT family DNA-binding domain-containing protein [Pediococcus claussenii]|uniref:AbrB family transcriptional regulator n=1 Tax=Pediococcus claussenii (strain ATCC BAA-344 / DSM 14800 / JCM 18046 / KCTC 3811 / LMG 21948 / P06) TaxID=701521 RepID=G8PBF3_PEDCP|nr:hypothetical protein [Pediococcus claussenii]AEV95942.1 hypothetical protein PECL_1728 [Pediococcus claussenii ATCC BAA-344]ANZ69432.1 hypothetical protein AYR57_03520 [Pediococcus claussenii]ANZ71252.1 hypothetical protein AYR58_03535 [Pediococcus claussenii]KRN20549.1 hypothetical protein IV79_GL000607 [Pediococcus claussenii]
MNITTGIKKIGDSQGVELSKEALESIGVTDFEHQTVDICVKNNRIIVSKHGKEDSRLMKNFGHLTDEPSIGEVDLSHDEDGN